MPANQRSGDAEMTFIEHLEELRWHLVRSLMALGVLTILAFLAKGFVFDNIIFAPTHKGFLTYALVCRFSKYAGMGEALCVDPPVFHFINIEMAGQFLIHLKVSVVLGFIASMPYMLWELWRFIRPGLYEHERRATIGIVFSGSLLFLIGVAFGYYILTPFALNFFANYTISSDIANAFTVTNYIGFLTMFVLACGLVFELPMVVYFLSKLGLMTPAFMRNYRKHAIIVILIIAAVVTPADVGTQLLVAVPLAILYEISIFISAYVEKQSRKELNDFET